MNYLNIGLSEFSPLFESKMATILMIFDRISLFRNADFNSILFYFTCVWIVLGFVRPVMLLCFDLPVDQYQRLSYV